MLMLSQSEWDAPTHLLQAYDAYEQRVLKKQSWNSLLIRLHKLSKGK